MPNAIEASFGLDLAPLKRDFAQAEAIGRTGAAKVQSAIARANKANVNWGALAQQRTQAMAFLNQGGPRTAANFLPAPRGKYPSPAEQESGQTGITMRGLGRGITLVTAAHELAQAFVEANIAAAQLDTKINSITRTTGAGAFRGIGEMEANLKEAASTLTEIQDRTMHEIKRDNRDPLMTFQYLRRQVRQFMTGDSDENEEAQKNRLRKQAIQDIDAIAGKQAALNEAEAESFDGSERQAEILKEQITHREKLGRLAEMESAAGVNEASARNAENERDRQAVEAIAKRFDIKKQEEEVENRILNLHASSLTKDQQSLVAIRERINLLKQRIAGPGSEEEKTALGLQLHRLENEQTQAQYSESNKPWKQRAAEMQEQQNYRNFVARQTPSNPNAYLSNPAAYNRRDILGNQIDAAGNVIGAAPKTPETGPPKADAGLTKEDINGIITAINRPDWTK